MGFVEIRSSGMSLMRRARSALGGAAVILTYHRVADAVQDPHGLAVRPERFQEHIAAFASRYELMTAGSLLRRLAEGRRLPHNGLVITLDDGYADALTHARPILEAHSAPATVFVASGFVTGQREFWWDELERLVLTPPSLPERLELRLPDTVFERTLSDLGRAQLYLDLNRLLEPLPASARESALEQLSRQTGAPHAVREDVRPLKPEELPVLAADGLVEIGAHTVHHVRLGSLPIDEQREEIEGSKRALEAALGHEVVSFSYPYGTAGSFGRHAERIVREAGFLGAVTTQLGGKLPWASVSARSDRFALPRTATADVPASELIATIDKRLGL